MAKEFFDDETFEELLKVAKQKPVIFAFAKGKELDKSVLGLRRLQGGGAGGRDEDDDDEGDEGLSADLDPQTKRMIKKGRALAKLAKKEPGASTKTAYGTATARGMRLTLTCFEYVTGMKKALKAKFKKHKKFSSLKFQIVVPSDAVDVDPDDVAVDQDDEILEEDLAREESEEVETETEETETEEAETEEAETEETETEESETEEAPPEEAPAAPDLSGVVAGLKQAVPRVSEALKADPGRKQQLLEAVDRVKQGIQVKDAEQASSSLTALEELLEQSASPASPPPPQDNGQAQKLTAALARLRPAVNAAAAAHPARRADLVTPVADIEEQIAAGRFDDARQALLTLGALVKELSAAAPQSAESPELAKLKAALVKLSPLIKAAAASNPDRRNELVDLINQIKAHIAAAEAAQAREAIEKTVALLKELQAGPAKPEGEAAGRAQEPESEAELSEGETEAAEEEAEESEEAPAEATPTMDDATRQRLLGAMEKLEPALFDVIDLAPYREEEVDRLKEQFRQGMELGDEEMARDALFQLNPLSKPPAEAVEEARAMTENLNLAFRARLLEWQKVRTKAHEDIRKLKSSIVEEYADDADAGEIGKAVGKLDRLIERLDDRLDTLIVDAINANPEEKPRHMAEVGKAINEYLNFVNGDPLMGRLNDNPFVQPMTVQQDLRSELVQLVSLI